MTLRSLFVVVLAPGICLGGIAFADESGAADSAKLAFVPGDTPNEYRFDTGVLRGTIPLKEQSLGLLPAVHVPTDTPLAASMGLFNYYRVFKTNHRFVESMRATPSTARLLPDGALEVHWLPGEERPFDLTAVYRWTAPNILDLETTVKAEAELPDFEVFLASYCTERLPVSQIYVRKTPDGRENAFMAAEESFGLWQAYPRNEAATAIIKDGRWTKPPSPVDWVIMPELAAPLIYRRAPDTQVAVVIMAPPEDAFAVFTPRANEAHLSMYLGLFGRTLAAGELAKARSRLLVTTEAGDEAILAQYRAYVDGLQKEQRP
ncbi:MAG TPA: hypothetical protein PLM14_11185 [Candidatus Hydrogenedentes bacterium]|nr:hypothetical protein [Candidatus Hydrogenedentota bacterium]HQH52962.1 hypothetical protein [Candidatus Hydrogenedentota bacterium]